MSLGFDQLREENVRRCEESYHPLAAWTETDWACALGGEVGELLNVIKKLRRLGYSDLPDADLTIHEQDLLTAAGKELADVVIYADLLAARIGLDLGAEVRAKFNLTSAKVGSPRRL